MVQRLRHARTARRDERGVVALFMVVMLAVLMVSAAFVVDLGLQRVGRSDMQALADVVALDLARELDGRTVAQLEPVLPAKAQESIARNRGMIGDTPDLAIELGSLADDGTFAPMSSGVPSVVSVSAATDVSFAFAGVTGNDSGAAMREAAAETSATACFRLGSFVASIRSSDSTVLAPLNDLLGVNLDLVGYQALANADLRVSQLVADPRVGTPAALLEGGIEYDVLLDVMLEALKGESSSGNALAITALTAIATSDVAAAVGPVRLGDVLNVSPGDRAAMEVELNVLDIVGSARIADGDHFVGVPKIQAHVPGTGFQFSGGLYLISAAELACGAPNSEDAEADTAQLDGRVDIAFTNLPSMNIPGLGTLQTPKGNGSIEIQAGAGTGQLVAPPSVDCGAGTASDPATFSVKLDSSLASYKISTNLSVAAEVKTTDLLGLGLTNVLTSLLGNILGIPNKLSLEVDVTLTVGSTVGPGDSTHTISIPPNDVTPVSTGSPLTLDPATLVPELTGVRIGGKVVALGAVTAVTDLVVDHLIKDSNGFFLKSLTPLVDNINEIFVGPVARMVGIRLGGADVFGVEAACGTPRLVG